MGNYNAVWDERMEKKAIAFFELKKQKWKITIAMFAFLNFYE